MTFFDPDAIEREVRSDGRTTMTEFFRMAKINKSTWNRWSRKETTPNMTTWHRVEKALDKLEKRRGAQS